MSFKYFVLIMIFRNLFLVLQILLVLSIAVGLKDLNDVGRVKRLATPTYTAQSVRNTGKYVVSIRSRTPYKYFGDNHYCGGCIISPIFILTAAKCVMRCCVEVA
ncbi:uncharacterized protein Dmoj_GI26046 [Drosophila mojavensis]|uniref:Peptidase S1 domain-containing protein n=1 Tax=Drosophila mojavensis TaxID=7230 RepID=A0A0Q9XCN1_DROMO|nr:uncharacterized protein Dmoj_GI26046 [Drosophila mojavensis]